jgi:hypothetical protein
MMTTDNICFYLQNRLIQTSKTGGQQYSNTFPFSIPWLSSLAYAFHINGTMHFKKCKQLLEHQHLLSLRDMWWSKF